MSEKIKQKLLIEKEKQVLEEMLNYLSINMIKFNDFENYYNHLKNYISLGINDYLTYAIALYNAQTIIYSPNEEVLFKKYQHELNNIISTAIRADLADRNINLVEQYQTAKEEIEKKFISIEKFTYYCDIFKLALLGGIENIDYLDWAKILQDAKITPSKTYDESVKVQRYKKLLCDLIEQVKQSENIVNKR